MPAWAELLAGRRVTIVMDCDAPGRRAADEIAASLDRAPKRVEVVDLWPDRDDGYDLTDRILERRQARPWGFQRGQTRSRSARLCSSETYVAVIEPSHPTAR